MNTAELSKVCKQVRRDIINMTANASSGHPGGSLSMTDLMTCLFFNHMRIDPTPASHTAPPPIVKQFPE